MKASLRRLISGSTRLFMTVTIVSKGGAWDLWHPGQPGDRDTSIVAADPPRCSDLIQVMEATFILHCQGYAVRIIRQTRCPAPCRPPGTVLSQTVKLDWIPYACQLISFGKFLEYWIPNIFSLGKWVNTSDNLWQHCPGHGDWLRCWPDTHWPDQIYDQGASFYILCF